MKLIAAIAIALILFLWQQNLYKRLWDEGLDVDISFKDSYINTGDKSSLVEVINNDKILPLPVLHVKFSTERSFQFDNYENVSVTDCYHRNDAFSVASNQKITRVLDFKATKRGVYTINGITITAKDFFMTKTFAAGISCYDVIYVLPRKIEAPELNIFFNTILGDMETKRGLLEDPYTFRGIKEYDRRDNMSKINWKATARSSTLMVNQYGYSWEPRVKLLLNLDTNLMIKSDYITELSIELASSIAQLFIEKGVSVALQSNGLDGKNQPLGYVRGGTTREHLITIDKYLASISNNSEIDGFLDIVDDLVDNYDGDSTYIIISSYYKNNLLHKIDYLKESGMDVHMIVPYFHIQKISDEREYMYQWEVKLDET